MARSSSKRLAKSSRSSMRATVYLAHQLDGVDHRRACRATRCCSGPRSSSRSSTLKACSGTSRAGVHDLLAREARADLVLAGRVADHRGEVADEEDRRCARGPGTDASSASSTVCPRCRSGRVGVEAGLDAQRRPLRGAPRARSAWRSTTPRQRIDHSRSRAVRAVPGPDRRTRVDRATLLTSSGSSSPPVMAQVPAVVDELLQLLADLEERQRLAGTGTGWPVRGLRPLYGLYGRTVKLPKPRISMPSPRCSASVIASKTQLTTSSARALVKSACVRRSRR